MELLQNDTLIELTNVSFSYENQKVLNNISLSIKKNSFGAILGASGSGKSTLLNLIGLLNFTTTGNVTSFGRNVKNEPEPTLAFLRRAHIGFIFQNFSLLPKLTVLENMLLPYQLAKLSISEIEGLAESEEFISKLELENFLVKMARIESVGPKQRAMQLLQQFGILEIANALPSQVSGGQKQRAAIARSLMLFPDIILADEPTGALDSENSENVMKIFKLLYEEGNTIIVITHDEDVAKKCMWQITLKDGGIVEQKGLNAETLMAENRDNKILGTEDSNSFLKPSNSKLKAYFSLLKSSVLNLWSQKLRTVLSMLGLLVGVASIVVVTGATEIIQSAFTKIFYTPVTRKSYLFYDKDASIKKGTAFWNGINLKYEFPNLRNSFSKYANLRPMIWTSSCEVSSRSKLARSRLTGFYDVQEYAEMETSLKSGRFPNPVEVEGGNPVAVLGSETVNAFFEKDYPGRQNKNFPVGERIVVKDCIQDTVFLVIGLLEPRDTSFGNRDSNDRIYVSSKTIVKARPYYSINAFSILPNDGVEPRWIVDNIKSYLEMKAGNRIVMEARIPAEVIEKVRSFLTVFQIIMSFIGGLCILVGGIGVMNVMLVSVAERTREIGLLKSFGSSPKQIKSLFLMDALVLCILGGLAGSSIGFILNNVFSFLLKFLNPLFSNSGFIIAPLGLLVGVVTSIFTALFFGILPAIRASNMDASSCLREE